MLNTKPTKDCKHCKMPNPNHWPYQCHKNPKQRKTPKTMGKYAKQWVITRNTWIRNNPPNYLECYWLCYLRIAPNCRGYLTERTLTLDHVVARSRDPSKRFDQDNLKPACMPCNELKGSRSLDQVL